MSEERRKRFGGYLARLRRELRLSQRQLAERVCRVSATGSVTRHEISRWERGTRIPVDWLPSLAIVYGVPLAELENAAEYARGGDLPTGEISPAETLAAFLPASEEFGPLVTRVGRRVGVAEARDLAARAHGLRLADDVIAGRDLIIPAFRELRAAVRFYQETCHSEEVGRALLRSIGELAQIAGWIAADAGRFADADRAYRQGLSAAREAGERPLVGNLAGNLAYLYSNNGREADGIALACAALEEAGPDAPAQARALTLDRIAWAHTQVNAAQPAMRALAMAHEALTQGGSADAPKWAYWVTADELKIMDARVYTELRKPLRAVPLLQEALARYDATHVRELALYLSWLAVALVAANEPEQAAEVAFRMLDLSADLPSTRIADRTRHVLTELRPFQDLPEVRAVLDAHFPAE